VAVGSSIDLDNSAEQTLSRLADDLITPPANPVD